MGQKANLNIFNLLEKNNKQIGYFNKKSIDNLFYLKINLEIKTFCKKFLKNYKIILSNYCLICLSNFLWIYISYYKELKINCLKTGKIQIIDNCFKKKHFIKDLFTINQ